MTSKKAADVTVLNLRGIPRRLARELRILAVSEDRTMTAVAIEALEMYVRSRDMGLAAAKRKKNGDTR
jgi:predicted transcriptional regulator